VNALTKAELGNYFIKKLVKFNNRYYLFVVYDDVGEKWVITNNPKLIAFSCKARAILFNKILFLNSPFFKRIFEIIPLKRSKNLSSN